MPTKKFINKDDDAHVLNVNDKQWQNRILVATPMTGNVRAEWVFARYQQVIPTNWSMVQYSEFVSSNIPLNYQVADAYNLIAKVAVEKDFEWVLFIESDNVIPQDTFVKINNYMIENKYPVVGGVYFTKSVPPEPLMYRGIGNGYFDKWKFGDKVWVDGLPFGLTLISNKIIKAMWAEAPEYSLKNQITRKVFRTPNELAYDPETHAYNAHSGTQDLDWCQRVMKGNYFEKAGWSEYKDKKYPFLVDTSMFVKHITQEGVQYPISVPPQYIPPQGYQPKEVN